MRALILTGKFATVSEVIYPYYRLLEDQWTVDVAAQGKELLVWPDAWKIQPNRDPSEVVIYDYDLLVLPGGAKAMEYMRQDQKILDIISGTHGIGRVVASICHGAQLLISAGLVRGRRISGYYSIKDDITNAGGTYVDEPAVVDDRIVTSPHYKHLGPWMAAALEQCAASPEAWLDAVHVRTA